MRLMLLGHTGAGKTTFVASCYGAMHGHRPGGLSLRALAPSDHAELLRLHEGVATGRYPDATDCRAEYRLELRHHDTPIAPFHWSDYRGSALREPSRSQQAQHVTGDLASCEGVIVFRDGTARPGPAGRADLGRIGQFLTQAVRDAPLPVVLVMTKADRVAAPLDRASDVFEPMRKAIAASDRLFGAVVPVSCAPGGAGPGVSLAYVPLLFLLRHHVREMAARLEKEHLENACQAREHRKRAASFFGVGDWLERVLSGTSAARRASACDALADEARGKLAPVSRALEALLPLIRPLPTFGAQPRN